MGLETALGLAESCQGSLVRGSCRLCSAIGQSHYLGSLLGEAPGHAQQLGKTVSWAPLMGGAVGCTHIPGYSSLSSEMPRVTVQDPSLSGDTGYAHQLGRAAGLTVCPSKAVG